MNAIGLSPEHEANLRKHAAFLLHAPVPGRFDMGRFDDADDRVARKTGRCGSVGCSLGWATMSIRPRGYGFCETWHTFARRVFGLNSDDDGHRDRGLAAWDWCFSADWTRVDDTQAGAAKRILYLLKFGLPAAFPGSMYREHLACYQDYEPTPEDLAHWPGPAPVEAP